MITYSSKAFLEAFADLDPVAPTCAHAVFLVRPAAFSLAAESATDNVYMDVDAGIDPARAAAQHAGLAEALQVDVPVTVFSGPQDAPDAMFPNNVFATTPKRLIVGRMHHPVRQREAANPAIRGHFAATGRDVVDLSTRTDVTAELTGSLIIDRARGVGFAGLSARCSEEGARAMHEAFGLKLTYCFDLAPSEYHTNVVMTLLASRAVILAADGFADPTVPRTIAKAYGDRCLWLSPAQKQAFAGNAITLSENRVWMSASGAASLDDEQRKLLSSWDFELSSIDMDEIEKAGGSLRCCVAEVF